MGVITRARTLLVVLASAGLWRCAGGSRALSHSRIRHAVAPASARRSAVLAAEQQPAAEAARSQGKKILIEVEDENIWAAEQLELADMARATATPFALRGYIGSETKDAVFPSTRDVCFHAFERFGEPLEAFDGWPGAGEAGDKARLALITDLLGAVNHLHGRGLPHLCVNEGTVRIGREPLNNELRLRIVGAGAGPSLNAANRTFQVPRSWGYTAPEVLSGVIVQSNLPALFAMDAWSVGTVLAMLVGGLRASPQAATPQFFKLQFSERSAILQKINDRGEGMQDFLSALNDQSGGFLFRNGWLVEMLISLLKIDPQERMSVRQAWKKLQEQLPPPLPPPKLGTSTPARAAPAAPAAAPAAPAAAPAASSKTEQTLAERVAAAFPSPALGADGVALPPPVPADASRVQPRGAPARVGGGGGVPSQEPYRSLEAIISIVEGGESLGRITAVKRRPAPPTGSEGAALPPFVRGEVVGFRNRARGERWEMAVAGAAERGAFLNEGDEVEIESLIGIVLVRGGAHVLVVELVGMEPNKATLPSEVRGIVEELNGAQGRGRCKYLGLESLDFSDRSTLRDIYSFSLRQS